ncbi:MAG: YceI family protein [Planctomycetes bacterium]|nr:YceI family protein [Planctomycetota bacterium]
MSLVRSLPLALILSTAIGVSAYAEDTFVVDGVHSAALFRINHFNIGNFYGRFNDVGGTIVWNAADVTKSTVSFTIKADSIDTNNAKRDQHLKGPDFFDAKQFETATFTSTSIKAVDAKNMEVTGDLTVHGVTKPVTAKVVLVGEGKGPAGEPRIGFEATFDLKRTAHGMTFMSDKLGDDVHVIIAAEGVKK